MLVILPCFLFIFLFVNTIENINPEVTEISFSFLFANNKVVAQETGWINYTIDSSGNRNSIGSNLSTIIPFGWQTTEDKITQTNQTTATIVFLSPKENYNDLFQENIVLSIQIPTNIFSIGNGVNTEDIVDKLKDQYDEFSFENMSTINMHNLQAPAESIVYTFSDAGLFFKTKQVFLTTSNGIYIFSLLAEQNKFDKYVHIFDQVLKNIRLVG
jgi:hypothetical protein